MFAVLGDTLFETGCKGRVLIAHMNNCLFLRPHPLGEDALKVFESETAAPDHTHKVIDIDFFYIPTPVTECRIEFGKHFIRKEWDYRRRRYLVDIKSHKFREGL